MECIDSLKRLSTTNNVIIGWVPGHSGIDGNEMADTLAKVGAEIQMNGPEPYLGIPKSTVIKNIQERMNYESYHVWVKAHG